MKIISKGETSDIDGVVLSMKEYEDILKDKKILEQLSNLIKNQ